MPRKGSLPSRLAALGLLRRIIKNTARRYG
jgi:hypothetical protein